jgi:hypothetical protein
MKKYNMKEIQELILKEKQKKAPNKEYIQFLQQLSDTKELSEYFVKEVKQQNFLERQYRQNTMEMDDFFKNSGKTEKSTNIVDQFERQNTMVDRLKDYMEDKKKLNKN